MPLASELTLASSPRAAADARRWVGDICHRLERTDLVECAELGVSELVANAIIHANAPFKVRVRGTASCAHCRRQFDVRTWRQKFCSRTCARSSFRRARPAAPNSSPIAA